MVARVMLTVLFFSVPAAILAPSVAAQGSDTIYAEAGVLSDPAGAIILLLAAFAGAALLTGVVLLLRNRRQSRQRLEGERRATEEEFANLASRMDAFDEKERLVGGYLEAQRPLLERETEGQVEALIEDARSAGFGEEFSEAASRLASDPSAARQRMENGRQLLEGALEKLQRAETTIDDYRATDEALDGKLRVAAQEIESAEGAEEEARAAGVSVRPAELRPEYDWLAREVAGRTSRRDEFDPHRATAAVDALAERARKRQTALRDEIAASAALPEERSSAEYSLTRAQVTLEEYRRVHTEEENRWGPAALEGALSPEELSSGLRHAEGCIAGAGRAEASGRFAKARSLLEEAAALCQKVMQAPRTLKATVVEADRKRREGEEKLKELEARLELAKANEHMMDPSQRQRLSEFEQELQNACYNFFEADWPNALLIFETLDHDYVDTVGGPDEGYGETFESWSRTAPESRAHISFRAAIRRRRN